jgi:hypothetical protein
MASRPKKSKFQNTFSLIVRLPIGFPSSQKTIDSIFFKNGQEMIQMQRIIHMKHQYLFMARKWTS